MPLPATTRPAETFPFSLGETLRDLCSTCGHPGPSPKPGLSCNFKIAKLKEETALCEKVFVHVCTVTSNSIRSSSFHLMTTTGKLFMRSSQARSAPGFLQHAPWSTPKEHSKSTLQESESRRSAQSFTRAQYGRATCPRGFAKHCPPTVQIPLENGRGGNPAKSPKGLPGPAPPCRSAMLFAALRSAWCVPGPRLRALRAPRASDQCPAL